MLTCYDEVDAILVRHEAHVLFEAFNVALNVFDPRAVCRLKTLGEHAFGWIDGCDVLEMRRQCQGYETCRAVSIPPSNVGTRTWSSTYVNCAVKAAAILLVIC